MRSPHVVVLGAGVCGLYAARVLVERGVRVTVLERADVVGGLAAGRERAGNHYDFGVHQLHAFDRAIFEDIRAIMGERMIAVEKAALIRYGKGYRRYPLEFGDLLGGIPPWTLARAMTGLVTQQAANRLRPSEPQNAEEALIQLYGRPLYGFFFRDFTHHYWGIPPTELSATFVRQKMPRLSAVDVVKKALSRLGAKESSDAAVESALAGETLYYSRTGAREMPMALADYIRSRGGAVCLQSPVTGIETARDPASGRLTVRAVRYDQGGRTETLECDACLSTLPLAVLIRALGDAAPDPAPGGSPNGSSPRGHLNGSAPGGAINGSAPGGAINGSASGGTPNGSASDGSPAALDYNAPAVVPGDVREAAEHLRHLPVAVYGFLVRRPRVLDAQYVYYRDRSFHRLAEPKNCGMQVTPEDHTVLLAETTCAIGDDRWNGGEATRRRMIADMEAEGLLRADEVVETHVFHDEFAYPVFALGFEPHLARVEAFLGAFANLRATGRQGGFCYPNMHGAMRMGANAAVSLVESLPAPAHPERDREAPTAPVLASSARSR